MKLKIRKGDMVQVIAGGSKGKTGKVLQVMPTEMKVLIEGVNVVKRHVKPSQKNPQGGITTKESPIHYSNVLLMDSKGKPTRVGMKKIKDGKKTKVVRVAKTTGDELVSTRK